MYRASPGLCSPLLQKVGLYLALLFVELPYFPEFRIRIWFSGRNREPDDQPCHGWWERHSDASPEPGPL